ncbi:hypothetical protein GCM10009712_20490 [Pseudarthrobacter sulfonivorans]|uniref:choice-of-anchor D domain-containing protein n=1 Tax=Pseudarthrobacter sulfonivorans TaxID=121292 RepID=UPI00168BF610|nr:choice-of-anchor D domain-containing protein [Pseudarthrobacter sulfonivorans]
MPAGSGSWAIAAQNSEILAVHAALLPSGKVLFFSGSEHDEAPLDPTGRFNATRLWDPADNIVRIAGGPAPEDLFCCGHCILPDGDVFVAGGTEYYEDKALPEHARVDHFTGSRSAVIFDWRGERWHPAPPMAQGRWYPSCLTVADGRVMVLSGHANTTSGLHENTFVETFDPGTGTWTAQFATIPPLEDTGGSIKFLSREVRPMVYYPRLHQLPDGRIFSSTALRVANVRRTRTIDLPGRTVTDLGPPPPFGDAATNPANIYARSAFASVLLALTPPFYGARILICGQHQPLFFEPHNAHLGWRPAGSRNPNPIRAYGNAVLLPDKSVLVVGGATSERLPVLGGGADTSAVHHAERFVPDTDTWEPLATSPHNIARVYHSVALLLADGRVWIAGSNHDSDRNHAGVRKDDPTKGDARELRIEVFSPPYLFTTDPTGAIVPAPRPAIGPTHLGAGHGQLFPVPTPVPNTIRKAHLVRAGSATHAMNLDQRLIVLEIVWTDAASIAVRMPPNGAVAPPGYYLLFLFDNVGTPSVGRFVRLSPTYPLAEVYVGRPLTIINEPDPSPYPVLDLGTVDVGASLRGLIAVRNVGTGPLRLNDIAFSGDFLSEDIPPAPLLGFLGRPRNVQATIMGSGAQSGEFVKVDVKFTPTTPGRHVGRIFIHTNADDLPHFFIDLEADVPGLEMELFPSGTNGVSVEFGIVEVGTSAVREVMLRNRGPLDASVDDLVVDDAGRNSGFQAPQVVSERLVRAGQSRTFPFFFSPIGVGPAQTVLTLVARSLPGPSRFTRQLSIVAHAEGTGPRLVASPSAFIFVQQLIRTSSPPQTLTVRNTGSSPLHISSIVTSSDWALEQPIDQKEILPAGSLDVGVVFRPGTDGPLTGVLLIDSNAPGPSVSVPLEGTGKAAPIASLSPPAVAFGPQVVGTHGISRKVHILNNGAAELHVAAVSLFGPNAGDYQVIADSCTGGAVSPEGTCVIDVQFTPSATGNRGADLEIIDDAGGSPRTVSLTGTGAVAPILVANPSAQQFGPEPLLDSSERQGLVVTNQGTDPLTITGVGLTGTAAADFSVAGHCMGTTLSPGAACALEVIFRPTVIGGREAEIVITAAPAPPVTVGLAGTGVGAAATFDPDAVTFPSQPVGSFSQRQDIWLKNIGNAPLAIASIGATGDFRQDNHCGDLLRPGGSCLIRVIFTPILAGGRSGAISVTDSSGKVYRMQLDGVGVEPRAALNSATRNFGEQAAGTTGTPQTVQLTNAGTGPLIVNKVAVTGANADAFTTGSNTCSGAVLYPGTSCAIGITFAPQSVGPFLAEAEIVTNASDSPHKIRLSGTGVP